MSSTEGRMKRCNGEPVLAGLICARTTLHSRWDALVHHGKLFAAILALVFSFVPGAQAGTNYVYDDLGRLVQVTYANGASIQYEYDAVGNITATRKIASGAVAIASFAPTNGAAGTSVTLYGSGFSTAAGENVVRFNGAVASVTSVTASRLTATIPSGATTGPVSVTTPAGQAVSASAFIVTPLSITGFSPITGLPGTSVSIFGSGFAPAVSGNQVAFFDKQAAAHFASTTQVRATVPQAARSGPISITTALGVTVSAADFVVPPAGYAPADIVTTGRLPVNGVAQDVTIGMANRIAVLLFDGLEAQRVTVVKTNVTMAGGTYRIFAPSGVLFFTGDIRNNDADDLPVLVETGTYSLVMIPGSNTGSARISIAAERLAPIPVNAPMTEALVAGQNAYYSFDAVSGQGYSLIRTSFSSTPTGATASVVVYAPNGAQLKLCGTFQASSGNCDFVATESGVHRIRINPAGVAATAFTLLLSEDLAGTLTLNAGPVKFLGNLPGQNIRYSFQAQADQGIALVYRNGVSPQGTLYIYKPDGSVLDSSPNGFAGAAWEVLDSRTTVAGTYTAVVFINGNVVGDMDVSIAADQLGVMSVNAQTAVSLVHGQNASYSFDGVAGQGYSLVRTAMSTVPSGGSMGVTVYKPDNTVLKTCSTFTATGGTCDFVVPAAGAYRVRFNPNNDYATSFTAMLTEDLSGTLTFGAPPVKFLSNLPGQNIRYVFEAAASQSISFVFQNGITEQGTLYIYKPDGTVLANSPNSFNGATWEVLEATTTVAGVYTAVVFINGNSTGNMDVSIAAGLGGAIAVNAATPVALTFGQDANLTLNGVAGQGYSLVQTAFSSNPSGAFVSVTVYKPDGTQLKFCGTYSSSGGNCDFVTPVSGAYRIKIDPTGVHAVALTLYLSEDLSGTLLIGGAPVQFAPQHPGQNIRYAFEANAARNVRFQYTNGNGPNGTLHIYNPNGTLLTSLPNTFNGAATRFLDASLPAAGTYQAVIFIYGTWAGQMDTALLLR